MNTLTDLMNQTLDGLVEAKVKRDPILVEDYNKALDILKQLGQRRLQSFVIDKDNEFVYINMLKWLYADESCLCLDPDSKKRKRADLSKGIYIAGPTGTGKTWCLEMLATMAKFDRIRLGSGNSIVPLAWQSIRAADICDYYCENGNIALYKSKRVLCIQDVGSEPVESMYMGNRLNVIRQLLEHRGDKTDQLTLITSNFSIGNPAIKERYDDRVVSRLHQMCNYYELKGQDRRK